jgi:hypothetical protein
MNYLDPEEILKLGIKNYSIEIKKEPIAIYGTSYNDLSYQIGKINYATLIDKDTNKTYKYNGHDWVQIVSCEQMDQPIEIQLKIGQVWGWNNKLFTITHIYGDQVMTNGGYFRQSQFKDNNLVGKGPLVLISDPDINPEKLVNITEPEVKKSYNRISMLNI